MFISRLSLLLLALLLPLRSLWAGSLPMPEGPIILKVGGKITHTNIGDEAHFDYQMLAALGMVEIETRTPWTEGVSDFAGPLGRDLLDAVGAQGELLKVKALNEFVAEVPVADLRSHDVILAVKRDGERMPVRDFGPIFVLYPFDQNPKLLNETYRFRSVWQVSSIRVE
ncbi:oxidoreductase [Halomonas sp. McH1-25]|uniref:oxidoreductase n=1 Tax=unclassified Halomonas TaxID=2609666 RepID=UPI001EF50A6F|nr:MULTISPECIES: oxidoreductase [unclassified Halomonas]MCG7600260.1 oxidoreductase [Halomonas sp. McH1-25]MCP1343424.1 oxidoreductase [Halomonas sp. FL8]MCP1359627.1 oxidoreductase [Halomonas sp. BBD45]MCP1365585.1 oxidoreductase [Halomonas sp. BBD48]